MKKMGKFLGFLSLALMALVVGVSNTYAAADATLTSTIASSSSFFTDNSAVIVSFLVDVMLKLAGIALAIGAVYWVYRKIRSIFHK